MSELVITLIEQMQREGQLDAVELLAWEISESIGDDFERRVSGSGPDRRSNRHLWCVVLAAFEVEQYAWLSILIRKALTSITSSG